MHTSTPGDSVRHGGGRPGPPHPALGSPFLARLGDLWIRWRDHPELAVAGLVLLAVATGTLWYRMAPRERGGEPRAHEAAVAGLAGPEQRGEGATGAGPNPTAKDRSRVDGLVVHVAGAVARPGVYDVDAGARVADAIEAAGGPAAGADLDRLNLAAKVVDGQRVLVTRLGEPFPPGEGVAAGEAAPGTPAGGPLNLNTATKAQLEALPGIGPTMAQAILDHRQRRGGFRSVRELLDVRGIGDARFAELRDLVAV